MQKLKIQEKGLVKEIRKVLSDDGGSLHKLPRNGIQENQTKRKSLFDVHIPILPYERTEAGQGCRGGYYRCGSLRVYAR